ncbi:MAG: hypothetical protein CYG61_00400, partial [Actinobacteria bacterium]
AATALVVAGEGPGGIASETTWALDATPPPPTPPGTRFTLPPNSWVTKLSPTGAVRYVTYLGAVILTSVSDRNLRIGVDVTGAAYVAGLTVSKGLPTTPGAYQPACKLSPSGSCDDVYVVVLGPGGGLRYATYLGGDQSDYPYGVSPGPGGTVYVAGFTSSVDFPTTAGAFQPECRNISDFGELLCSNSFLTKLTPSGRGAQDVAYSTFFSGSFAESASALAVDGEGIAYLTGVAQSTDMPTTPGAYQDTCFRFPTPSSIDCHDAFVVKLAPAGQGAADLRYSTYLGGGCCYVPGAVAQGGSGSDRPNAIALGPKGTIYVAGLTGSTDFPITPGAFDKKLTCASDFGCKGFLFKLAPEGQGKADLRYATYLGAGAADDMSDIAVDAAGRAVVVGSSSSATFPLRKPIQKRCGCATGEAGVDAVVAKLDPRVAGDGSGRWSLTNQALVFSSFLGGDDGEAAPAVALDASNNIWVVGMTESLDFPTTPNAFQPALSVGDWDGFASKITGVP